MDIRIQRLDCDRCEKVHEIEIDFELLTDRQKSGQDPVLTNFICPNIYLMYRVVNFALDTRVNYLKSPVSNAMKEDFKKQFSYQWGDEDFESKFKRFLELDIVLFGVPDEHYQLLRPIISSYCCGYFYPAMTSSGALGERILNRLLLKTRHHFKNKNGYKKIWKKDSFDNWDLPIELLASWGVISEQVANSFKKLKTFRNESIHYNEGYDFEKKSFEAIKALADVIDRQFNYAKRTDLLWVFNVPGEIWIRSEKLDDPFVKEFILPSSILLTPYCEPFATPPIKSRKAPLKPFSDEEFIAIKKQKYSK